MIRDYVWKWYGPDRSIKNQPGLVHSKWYYNTVDDDYRGPFSTEELAQKAWEHYSIELDKES